MNSMAKIQILFMILSASIQHATPLSCYSCQYNEHPSFIGYECVTNPENYTLTASTALCGASVTSCMSQRQVGLVSGNIWFMLRGCNNENTAADCSSDIHYETCIETCDSELCNNWNTDVPRSTTSTVDPTATTKPTTTTRTTIAPPGSRNCYSCNYGYNPGADDSCVTDPANAGEPNTVPCPSDRVCTIMRQWDNAENLVRSFSRGCSPQGDRVNECVVDIYFKTCNSYCTPELCNSGDGIVKPPSSANKLSAMYRLIILLFLALTI